MRKKVLVIVAHPDDETIWMGGMLLRNRDKWNTTIISLCRRDDKDRAPKFKQACKILNAKCFISDLEDEKLYIINLKQVMNRIKKFADKKYDYIFTHGKNGEYEHERHKNVHKAVKDMLRKKELSCKKIFFFSYIKKGRYVYPNRNSDKFINLEASLYNKKKNLITNVYKFDKNSFEGKCCREVEAFYFGKK